MLRLFWAKYSGCTAFHHLFNKSYFARAYRIAVQHLNLWVFFLFPFITTVRTMQCTAPLWETQYLPAIQNQWEQGLLRKGQYLPPARTRSLRWHFPPWRSGSAGSGARVPSLEIDRKKLLSIKKPWRNKIINCGEQVQAGWQSCMCHFLTKQMYKKYCIGTRNVRMSFLERRKNGL